MNMRRWRVSPKALFHFALVLVIGVGGYFFYQSMLNALAYQEIVCSVQTGMNAVYCRNELTMYRLAVWSGIMVGGVVTAGLMFWRIRIAIRSWRSRPRVVDGQGKLLK